MPFSAALMTIALVGGTPGETTIRSGENASTAVIWSSILPITFSIPKTSTMSRISSEADSATISTLAPSSCRVSATENPVFAKPITTTESCDQSECQLERCSRESVLLAIDPLKIEQSDSGQHRESGDNPEPNDNSYLCPTL